MPTIEVFQIVVSIAQIVAVVIMYRLAVRQYQMNRSSRYLERFLDKDLFELREGVDAWLESGLSTSEKLDQLNDSECIHTRSEIIAFANFFQEISISYKRSLTDKQYIYETFGFLIRRYWEQLQFWTGSYRSEKGRETLYEDWEDVYNIFKQLDTKKGK